MLAVEVPRAVWFRLLATVSRKPVSSPGVVAFEPKWIISSGSKSNWQLNVCSVYRDLSETFDAAAFVMGGRGRGTNLNKVRWSYVEFKHMVQFLLLCMFSRQMNRFLECWVHANIPIKANCCVCVLWLFVFAFSSSLSSSVSYRNVVTDLAFAFVSIRPTLFGGKTSCLGHSFWSWHFLSYI